MPRAREVRVFDRLTGAVVTVLTAIAMLAGCAARGGPTIDEVLRAHPEVLGTLPLSPEAHRVQIALAEVVDGGGRMTLRRSGYRVGAEYVYPASTIKLCAAIAALQVLEELNAGDEVRSGRVPPVTIDSPLRFHPLFAGEQVRDRDATNLQGGGITLRHEIRKLFLVSDNEAFNRLYEFVGHRELNERMRGLGLASTVLNHRLSVARSPEENRRTPRIDILGSDGAVVRTRPERMSDLIITNPDVPGLRVGEAFARGGNEIVMEPMDFTARNGMSLIDLQDLLILLARPEIDLGKGPLRLSDEHRRFLLDSMAEYPGDSSNPRYDRSKYPDDWGKFFLPGMQRVPGGRGVTIHNKVGQAYGFTLDNACIVEAGPGGRTFFLAATIYTNADGVINDNVYEYDTVAFPFMARLGEAVLSEVSTPKVSSRGADGSR